MSKVTRAKQQIKRWRSDPVQFVRDVLNVEPDPWQADFLNDYNDNNRICAKSAKGPGKTCVLAWCMWHFMCTRPTPKMAATSISGDNLRDGLWTELAKWMNRSEFLKKHFTWTKTRIYANDNAETHWISFRQWPKGGDASQQSNTLAGLHADYIMFVIDEAGGIPDAVMAAAEAALSSGIESKLLITGNPTHLSGPLWRACTSERSMWKLIQITGDPDNPKRSPRISIQWARDQIKKYGRDNPWVIVNVFGDFPPQSLNSLLGPDDMEMAYKRILRPSEFNWASKVLGVDVARQGDDSTVIAPRQGLACFKPKILRIPDTQQIAGIVAQVIRKWTPDAVFIDGTGGWGLGVVDALRAWGYECTDVQFAGKPLDRQYFNKRAEMAFEFAKWIKAGGALPRIPELTEEATCQEYMFKGDRMQLIDKAQIKELIGRSPDLFDAYMLTFAFPVAKKNPIDHYQQQLLGDGDHDPMIQYRATRNQVSDDYDPFA